MHILIVLNPFYRIGENMEMDNETRIKISTIELVYYRDEAYDHYLRLLLAIIKAEVQLVNMRFTMSIYHPWDNRRLFIERHIVDSLERRIFSLSVEIDLQLREVMKMNLMIDDNMDFLSRY